MGSNHYVGIMNNSFSTYIYAILASVLLLSSGSAGMACELEVTDVTNSNSVRAVVEGSGEVAVALSLSYRVANDSGQPPGAIGVFVRQESSENPEDWQLVDRIFPFSPSRPDETSSATIAIPLGLQPIFSQGRQLEVGLGFEGDFVVETPEANTLELDQATVIFD